VNSEQWSVIEWRGCYPSNWKGLVVTEAMAHPAKFSSKLIRKIYSHMQEEGWVTEGDNVLDPFGGVALGALEAMRLGLNWYGVELEEKFYQIGNANIEKWMQDGKTLRRWGTAHLLNGDSRFLLRVLADTVRVTVSSPPYAETPVKQTHMTSNKRGDPNNKNYRPSWKKKIDSGFTKTERPYGETPGQLGAMKAGGFDAAISSTCEEIRRLAEKKGSPRIDWEVVYCMEKTAPTPLSATQTSPQIGGRDLEGEIAEAVHG